MMLSLSLSVILLSLCTNSQLCAFSFASQMGFYYILQLITGIVCRRSFYLHRWVFTSTRRKNCTECLIVGSNCTVHQIHIYPARYSKIILYIFKFNSTLQLHRNLYTNTLLEQKILFIYNTHNNLPASFSFILTANCL